MDYPRPTNKKSYLYNYNTIIFDLDGTLFKADTIYTAAVHQVCESRRIEPVSKEYIISLIGEPSTVICRRIFGEMLSDEEVQAIREEIRQEQDKVMAAAARLYDGVRDMLDSLRSDGYTLCICSNGSKAYVDKVLNVFGIHECFKIIKSRIEGFSKHQLINQILEESACSSAIVVGDTAIDIEAAEKARCLSIGAAYGYGGDGFKAADFTADSAKDVYSIIKKVNGMYRDITIQMLSKKQNGKPLVAGINGVDTSGKTIFTRELERCLLISILTIGYL